MWKQMHVDWNLYGKGINTFGTGQRLTGQATTAIGNVITNLMVMRRFIKINIQHVLFLGVLGDDNVTALSCKPEVHGIVKHMK